MNHTFEQHPLAVSTPFSSASLHAFAAGLPSLGLAQYFDQLAHGAIQCGMSLEEAMHRMRQEALPLVIGSKA